MQYRWVCCGSDKHGYGAVERGRGALGAIRHLSWMVRCGSQYCSGTGFLLTYFRDRILVQNCNFTHNLTEIQSRNNKCMCLGSSRQGIQWFYTCFGKEFLKTHINFFTHSVRNKSALIAWSFKLHTIGETLSCLHLKNHLWILVHFCVSFLILTNFGELC
jgi:hypothetical protein